MRNVSTLIIAALTVNQLYSQTIETIPLSPQQVSRLEQRLGQVADTTVRNALPQGTWMPAADFDQLVRDRKRKNSLLNSSKK